jgi:hypothetical protein
MRVATNVPARVAQFIWRATAASALDIHPEAAERREH